MKAHELREKQLPELNRELVSLLKAHFGLRMQLATQQLSNTRQLKIIKRDIARVKTVITQKQSYHD
ncbi:MAG: 50S ribosomal protein L29 [Nitrosomonas sp.]|jgi:large subunit ribosomal protein L29|uniref:50S ribosomal protein L29 n=1 Tax=Nitrosomonas sp. TaxID=42353 RepID=UPI0027210DE7|nr:50S ribosomal protein L29 [Nitrosomonas sp.]MDO8894120.1 50S ribosomal protein L29 [Nitrosomonas sp.]MDO9469723.1 50S ribosomal protein L29 [Nitrosomonas sp.]MDP1551005.1 50S ribosomal protein L29 [Nitrosomonas sp.]MDP1787314.1 50S ribosomal protein L29 [Nitrosomonas sp.]MDP1935322.1 50S ribosomal protein L29 [Nitrosomonas sp.]